MTILSMSITDRANWPGLFLLPSVSVICNFIRFSQNYFFCHNYPLPLVNLFFCSCYKFNVSLFPYIVHSLSGHWLFIIFKNSFSKTFMSFVLSSVFVSTYDFNHAFWLNSIMLRTFLILAHDLVAASALLCAWHSFCCVTDYTSVFHTCKSSFFKVRMIDHFVLFAVP